jgi:hypothetical protein
MIVRFYERVSVVSEYGVDRWDSCVGFQETQLCLVCFADRE